jgi:hypothetical protein
MIFASARRGNRTEPRLPPKATGFAFEEAANLTAAARVIRSVNQIAG